MQEKYGLEDQWDSPKSDSNGGCRLMFMNLV